MPRSHLSSVVRRQVSILVRHPRLRVDRKALNRAFEALGRVAGKFRGGPPAGELSLVFLSDRALAGLHGRFLDDPAPTDVITFPGNPALGHAGEICISVDAARQSERLRAPAIGPAKAGPTSFSAELLLYLVHGWLHLAGYGDKSAPARKAMRRAEARAMGHLRRAKALPRFRLVNR